MIEICNVKKTTTQFIQDSVLIHGNNYDYSLVDYKNIHTKVIIICNIHGLFEQNPNNHLRGSKCPKCSYELSSIRQSKGLQKFIEQSIIQHDNKYDYSKVNYINTSTKVNIICPIHGEFEQLPMDHIKGRGCVICGEHKRSLTRTKTTTAFIQEANIIHCNKYDYSLTNYVNVHQQVKIICYNHGEFNQTPNSHLMGSGCPQCKSSKGELAIQQWLVNNNINYIKEYRISELGQYRFDFFIPDMNIIIEYDGIQHYYPYDKFGGIEGFNKIVESDNIKTQHCTTHNIQLIRIPYWKLSIIPTILTQHIIL